MTGATAADTSASPTRAVLSQVESGAGSVAQIAAATRLDVGVVGIVLDRLVASGHLAAHQLQLGCPEDGCRGCPTGDSGCSIRAANAAAGPVLLTLAVPPR